MGYLDAQSLPNIHAHSSWQPVYHPKLPLAFRLRVLPIFFRASFTNCLCRMGSPSSRWDAWSLISMSSRSCAWPTHRTRPISSSYSYRLRILCTLSPLGLLQSSQCLCLQSKDSIWGPYARLPQHPSNPTRRYPVQQLLSTLQESFLVELPRQYVLNIHLESQP